MGLTYYANFDACGTLPHSIDVAKTAAKGAAKLRMTGHVRKLQVRGVTGAAGQNTKYFLYAVGIEDDVRAASFHS